MTSKLNLLSLDKYDMEAVVAPAMLSLILIIPSVEVFIDFALVKDVFREIPSSNHQGKRTGAASRETQGRG